MMNDSRKDKTDYEMRNKSQGGSNNGNHRHNDKIKFTRFLSYFVSENAVVT